MRAGKKGKVVQYFTVEVRVDDPGMAHNTANPFAEMAEEERMKDIVDIFGILWAEGCRDKSLQDRQH
jgi:hypothetical protein